MAGLIIFATLLTVQFAASSSVETIRAQEYQSILLNTQERQHRGEIAKCDVETNIGEKFIYHPLEDQFRYDIRTIWDDCSIHIESVAVKDNGLWKIMTHYKDKSIPSKTSTFIINISQNVDITGSKEIYVYEGYYLIANMKVELRNVTECVMTTPNGTEIDLLTVNREGLYRYGDCGFRALMLSEDAGKWMLNATDNDTMLYSGYVNVDVQKEEIINKIRHFSLERGTSANLDLEIVAAFCQLVDPTGTVLPTIWSNCNYRIPVVTTRHEGTWFAHYNIPGKYGLVVVPFNVTTYDEPTIDSNATLTKDNEIQLFCRSYTYRYEYNTYNHNNRLQCYFIKPDGDIINMLPETGTSSYSAVTVPVHQYSEYKTCSLIIHKPKTHDYGSWKCIVRSRNGYDGSIIYVSPDILNANASQNSIKQATGSAERVFVKKDNTFQIKCSVGASLSYCWFRNPSNGIYTVSRMSYNNENIINPYADTKFRLGECVMTISTADFRHQGKWSCNAGIIDGPEVQQTVLVDVTDSYLIPERSVIENKCGSNTTLSCNVLPGETERAVHYCRWVRPDGYGIYNSVERYMTNANSSHCTLTITEALLAPDIGKWTCAAGLRITNVEESEATLTVKNCIPNYRIYSYDYDY